MKYVSSGVTVGDEELWYEQRFLLCYIVAVFLHCSNKIQVQDGSGYNNYSPKAKGVILLIFYKRDNIAELKVEQ